MDNQTIKDSLSNISDDQAVAAFIEELIEDKGLGGIDEEKKAELRATLDESLTDTINQALLYALPDEKFNELEELANSDDVTSEQVTELIANSGIDVKAVASEAMADFRRAFLEGGKKEA